MISNHWWHHSRDSGNKGQTFQWLTYLVKNILFYFLRHISPWAIQALIWSLNHMISSCWWHHSKDSGHKGWTFQWLPNLVKNSYFFLSMSYFSLCHAGLDWALNLMISNHWWCHSKDSSHKGKPFSDGPTLLKILIFSFLRHISPCAMQALIWSLNLMISSHWWHHSKDSSHKGQTFADCCTLLKTFFSTFYVIFLPGPYRLEFEL